MHFDVFGVDKYSGWKKVGNEWRFFKNGASVTNSWQKDGSGWMYLDSNGRITKSNWAKDSKGYCWLEANGYVSTATKWVKRGGDWYHITKGYRDQNKWMKDSKGWCYLGADGKMVTNGWAKDSKGYCWIASDGYMPVATKWIKYDGGWYHITKGYRDQSKWMKDSKGWCWLQADGRMLTNGWAKDSKGNCWIGPSGYMLETTRLVEYAGDTYGIEKGYMVTGRTIRIDGTDYTFDNDGKLIEAPDAGDQAGVSINRSEVDFGTVSIPIGENRRTLELNNEDSIPYRITIEQPANPLFQVVIYQEDVEAGTSAQLRVFLSSDNQEALETGTYEDAFTIRAEQIEQVGGAVVPEGKSVDMEVPLRVTIAGAAEDCTLTIDMQGHGENVSIHGLEPGASVSEVYNEWLADNYEENSAPVAAGYVYNGINLLPLSSYSDWDGYLADKEVLSDMVLSTDQTVYAMWLPEITHVEATLDAPVAGNPAETAPVVHLDPQSNCYVVPEKTNWVEASEDGLIPAQGTFENGKMYYTIPFFMPEFPYGFSRTDLRLIINDETYYPEPDYDNGISTFIIYNAYDSDGVGIRVYPYLGLQAGTEDVLIEPITLSVRDGESRYVKGPWSLVEDTYQRVGPYSYEVWSFEATVNMDMDQIDSYIRLSFDGDDAECFSASVLHPEGWGSIWDRSFRKGDDLVGCVDIHDGSGGQPAPGEYHAILHVYYDPSGQGAFDMDSPAASVELDYIIEEEPGEGWHRIDDKWYYCYSNDYSDTYYWAHGGLQLISDDYYCFEEDGSMVANGWLEREDYREKLFDDESGEENGGMIWGPVYLYAKSNGTIAKYNEWIKDGGDWYYLGVFVYGGIGSKVISRWIESDGYWYYLKNDGAMAANEWAKDSTGWMWMDANGRITKNKWVKDKGEWYYLKSNGYMAANEWAKDSGGWMWMNSSGKITKSQWIQSGGYWYYLKANGYMATGTQTINGKTYRFDSSGRWKQ